MIPGSSLHSVPGLGSPVVYGDPVLLFLLPKSYIQSKVLDHLFSEARAQLSLDGEGGEAPLLEEARVWEWGPGY